MDKTHRFWKGGVAAAVIALAFAPCAQADDAGDASVYRNVGPYAGGGIGYNRAADQEFAFAGTSTNPTQPTVPVELPANPNTGIAAVNSYKDQYFFGAVLGYETQNGLRVEFELSQRSNKADDISYPDSGPGPESSGENVKINTTSGLFNLWYDLFPSWRIHPYIGGGVGVSRFVLEKQPTNRLSHGDYTVNLDTGPLVCAYQDCSGPRDSDDAAFAYQFGGGVRVDLTRKLTLGLDYRNLNTGRASFYGFKDQQETHLDSEYKAQSLMASLVYYFAAPEAPPAPPAPAVPAMVKPVMVCSDGQDNDGDGKIDFPGDPGCESAEDDNETDPPPPPPACKTPAPGERISLGGCGSGDVIVLRGVNFEFDRANLTVNARTILDDVAAELHKYPDIAVEISGHTDAKGSDSYNQNLSDDRAHSVVGYLEAKGIDASRMSSVGLGESKPVADNETDEGRELNRRVELRVTSGVAKTAVVDDASGDAPQEQSGAADGPAEPAASTSPTSTPPPAPEGKTSEDLDWLDK